MKQLKDLKITSVEYLHPRFVLIKLKSDEALPEIKPGQFVEVKVEGSASTFLRRPISINYVDRNNNEIWLLVQLVGEGTKAMARLNEGDSLNVLFPLGNGFAAPKKGEKVLLVGGGVGVAPLLEYGKALKEAGAKKIFLYITHCEDTIFKGNLQESGLIEHVYTTNSIFKFENETEWITIV
jgi:dihydroorotate dehydrogenase electron transfer subunit